MISFQPQKWSFVREELCFSGRYETHAWASYHRRAGVQKDKSHLWGFTDRYFFNSGGKYELSFYAATHGNGEQLLHDS